MILLGLDLETSGLDYKANKITEVGCVLYDSEFDDTFSEYSSLVYDKQRPLSAEEGLTVSSVCGLSRSFLEKSGRYPKGVFTHVLDFFDECDAVVAHNGINFDKPFLESECERYGLKLPERPWIDTRFDIEYPESMSSRRLTHLATDHKIPVYEAHRTLTDITLMFELLKKYDIEEIFKKAQTPLIRVECSPPLNQNQIVKNNRYRWDSDKKVWWKLIREFDYEKETSIISFDLRKVHQ